MNTYYFSLIATNAKRRLEVRRSVAVEATHYDLAELMVIENHLFMAVSPEWVLSFVQITQTHYETLCGILEVAA